MKAFLGTPLTFLPQSIHILLVQCGRPPADMSASLENPNFWKNGHIPDMISLRSASPACSNILSLSPHLPYSDGKEPVKFPSGLNQAKVYNGGKTPIESLIDHEKTIKIRGHNITPESNSHHVPCAPAHQWVNAETKEIDFLGLSQKRKFSDLTEAASQSSFHERINHNSCANSVSTPRVAVKGTELNLSLGLSLYDSQAPKRVSLDDDFQQANRSNAFALGFPLESQTSHHSKEFIISSPENHAGNQNTPSNRDHLMTDSVGQESSTPNRLLQRETLGNPFSESPSMADPLEKSKNLTGFMASDNKDKIKEKKKDDQEMSQVDSIGNGKRLKKIKGREKEPDKIGHGQLLDLNIAESEKLHWAWIFAVSHYYTNPLDQELKIKNEEILSNFNAEMSSELIKILEKNSFSENRFHVQDRTKISSNVLHLLGILWYINMRLLRTLGKLEEDQYAEETILVYKWILRVLKNEENLDEIFDDVPCPNILDLFTSFINSRKEDKIEYVLQKGVPIGYVLEYQVIITELVLVLLNSYYKFKQPKKWEMVFINDGNFTNFLVKIQAPVFKVKTEKIEGDKTKIYPLNLLPWCGESDEHQEESENNLVLLRKKCTVKFNMNLKRYLKYVPNLNHNPAEEWASKFFVETIQSNENILMRFGGQEEVRKWNSILKIRQKIKMDVKQGHEVYFNSIRSRLKLNFNPKINKNLETAEAIWKNLRSLSLLIWELNSGLIFSLGHSEGDRDDEDCSIYLQEQTNLQERLFMLIHLSPHSLSNRHPYAEFKRFILGVLMINVQESSTLKIDREMQSAIETKAAVTIISYFYYQINRLKWMTVFQNSMNLIGSFQKIQRRSSNSYNLNRFSLNELANRRGAKLIPWANPFTLTSLQRASIQKFFQGDQS